MKEKIMRLEKRIERIENILIDLAYFKGRCAYIYLSDLQNALKKNGLIQEIPNNKQYKIIYKTKKGE